MCSCVHTDCRACVLWVCPVTDPWLNWLSHGVNGLPASSCGLSALVGPVALSPSVSLRVRDIIVSLLVLKSLFVDVEDFDRVVSAGTGKLDPGALFLNFTLYVSLSIRLVAATCSASPRPPAEPLYRHSMALSVKGCDKGNNRILLWAAKSPNSLLSILCDTAPSLLLRYTTLAIKYLSSTGGES